MELRSLYPFEVCRLCINFCIYIYKYALLHCYTTYTGYARKHQHNMYGLGESKDTGIMVQTLDIVVWS